jgi:hypothetical protein
VALYGRSRYHDRACQMRAAFLSLAAFEIAVRCARAPFLRRNYVIIGCDTHTATGMTPFESRPFEYFVQTFFFSLGFYPA